MPKFSLFLHLGSLLNAYVNNLILPMPKIPSPFHRILSGINQVMI